jgi:hypothetical protein
MILQSRRGVVAVHCWPFGVFAHHRARGDRARRTRATTLPRTVMRAASKEGGAVRPVPLLNP